MKQVMMALALGGMVCACGQKQADNVNPLYVLNSYIKSGNLYAILSRETDYSKILKNEIGNFLNSIRNDNPNDKFGTNTPSIISK